MLQHSNQTPWSALPFLPFERAHFMISLPSGMPAPISTATSMDRTGGSVTLRSSSGLLFPRQEEAPPVPAGNWQRGKVKRTQQDICAFKQWCAFFSLLLIWLFPCCSLMMLSEKPYHSFVEKTVLNQAGILEKLKKGRRIHQHRHTFLQRQMTRSPQSVQSFHSIPNQPTCLQLTSHKNAEGSLISGYMSLWEGEGKITGVGQTLDSSYCNSSDPSQPLWSVPEIADLVWSVMSWKGRAEVLRSNQMLNSVCLRDGWESWVKIRMIRKNNRKKKRKRLMENDILKASTSLQHIIRARISVNGSASFPRQPPQILQKWQKI